MALLAGKTAVITGGGSGIGLVTARRFIDEGAKVFITGRRADELETAVSILGPAAVAVQGDVTVSADLQRLYDAAAATGQGIDIVFANAAVAGAAPLGMITEEHINSLFGINVKGVVLTVQTLLPLLNEGASVILSSSTSADRGGAGTSVYAATKAAVRSFARTWANELASRNIRVNAVSPAPTDTAALATLAGATTPEAMQRIKDHLGQGIPLGRVAQPDEVANAALFLASELSSFTTGSAIPVDGGYNQI
jgi:NAD(P)-dependent dehydrogenase (short-subunit alcohol dehydrogenase family)